MSALEALRSRTLLRLIESYRHSRSPTNLSFDRAQNKSVLAAPRASEVFYSLYDRIRDARADAGIRHEVAGGADVRLRSYHALLGKFRLCKRPVGARQWIGTDKRASRKGTFCLKFSWYECVILLDRRRQEGRPCHPRRSELSACPPSRPVTSIHLSHPAVMLPAARLYVPDYAHCRSVMPQSRIGCERK